MKKHSRENGLKFFLFLILIIVGVLMAFPFYWMVVSSLKNTEEIFLYPPSFWPKELNWQNYSQVFQELPFGRFFYNSFYIALIVTVCQLFFCSLGGYAFARLRFPGRDLLFLVYLGSMMIPLQVRLVPLYILMQKFGWINSHLALIVPNLVTAWSTFMMRQFALTIPKELEDAARIDGCNYFTAFFRIIFPLLKPALITLAIFNFVGMFNDFLWPLIVISDVELKTLPVGLSMFRDRIYLKTPWHLTMAASTISTVPLIALFIFGQRYYVEGIQMSGLKL